MRQLLRSTLPASTVVLLASACAGAATQVEVENAGPVALDSVWLFATGDSAFLGMLSSGQTAEVRVRPRGESHLEFSHAAFDGRIVADTYLEPGYRGPIRVSLLPDSARVDRHARP